MKKMKKILFILMMLVLVTGCSCSNEECKCPTDNGEVNETETVVINDYTDLYTQTVRSVVMLRIQKKNDKSTVIATGSGVVAYESNNGRAYVYTNAHVVKGLTTEYEVEVFFSNDKGNFSGESEVVDYTKVYKDLYEDVAVIEIMKSSKYKLATIGDSEALEKGDFVYTIGSPLSKFNYTTAGHVSSVNTAIELDSSKTGVTTRVYAIMFDAAINEGNSGGALFNEEGKLVGITTLKYDEVYGMYGALPINFFDKVAKYLMVNRTSYVRPILNLDLLSVDELGSRKEQYNINSEYVKNGAYILRTREGNANIIEGHVIVAINGKTVKSVADFEMELLKYKVFDEVTITTTTSQGLPGKTFSVVLHD